MNTFETSTQLTSVQVDALKVYIAYGRALYGTPSSQSEEIKKIQEWYNQAQEEFGLTDGQLKDLANENPDLVKKLISEFDERDEERSMALRKYTEPWD